MSEHDEPILGGTGDAPSPTDLPPVQDRIRALLDREPYGVLCTQGDGQPYGSVVALASTGDLRTLIFATARKTRKYRLIDESDRVAVVVDSRGRHPDELMTVEAVTVTGRARMTEDDALVEQLVRRHPALASFVTAPTTAVIRVDVVRYLHVQRFQEVRQWIPAAP